MRPNDFASYLLAIGICNLLLYFAFYIIMKVRAEPARPLLSLGGRWQGLPGQRRDRLRPTCLCSEVCGGGLTLLHVSPGNQLCLGATC